MIFCRSHTYNCKFLYNIRELKYINKFLSYELKRLLGGLAIKKLLVLFCIFIVVVVSVMLFISNERDNDRDVRNFTSKNGTEGEYLIYPVKDAKGY